MNTLDRDYYDAYNRQHVHEMIQHYCDTPEKKVEFLNTLRESLPRPCSDFDMVTARTKTMADALEKAFQMKFGTVSIP